MRPFSALTTWERVVELARWVCVLPAAVLGDYAGYILGGILGVLAVAVGLVNPASDDSSWNRSLRYLIWMFPEGVTCVIAGAKTAPRWRLAIACVVAIVWILWVDRIHGFEGPTLMATAVAGPCGVTY